MIQVHLDTDVFPIASWLVRQAESLGSVLAWVESENRIASINLWPVCTNIHKHKCTSEHTGVNTHTHTIKHSMFALSTNDSKLCEVSLLHSMPVTVSLPGKDGRL